MSKKLQAAKSWKLVVLPGRDPVVFSVPQSPLKKQRSVLEQGQLPPRLALLHLHEKASLYPLGNKAKGTTVWFVISGRWALGIFFTKEHTYSRAGQSGCVWRPQSSHPLWLVLGKVLPVGCKMFLSFSAPRLPPTTTPHCLFWWPCSFCVGNCSFRCSHRVKLCAASCSWQWEMVFPLASYISLVFTKHIYIYITIYKTLHIF